MDTEISQLPITDVVFVIEGTSNMSTYIKELKEAYILPILSILNGGPPHNVDYGTDYSCTLYTMVTFFSVDIYPRSACRCTVPTSSSYELLQNINNMPMIGGQHSSQQSHMTEGLSTALVLFDQLDKLRKNGIAKKKHCILVTSSDPYDNYEVMESEFYNGLNATQIIDLMSEKNINLSLISARKTFSLLRLFEKMAVNNSKNYSMNSQHLILLKEIHLKERAINPHSNQLSEQDNNELAGVAAPPHCSPPFTSTTATASSSQLLHNNRSSVGLQLTTGPNGQMQYSPMSGPMSGPSPGGGVLAAGQSPGIPPPPLPSTQGATTTLTTASMTSIPVPTTVRSINNSSSTVAELLITDAISNNVIPSPSGPDMPAKRQAMMSASSVLPSVLPSVKPSTMSGGQTIQTIQKGYVDQFNHSQRGMNGGQMITQMLINSQGQQQQITRLHLTPGSGQLGPTSVSQMQAGAPPPPPAQMQTSQCHLLQTSQGQMVITQGQLINQPRMMNAASPGQMTRPQGQLVTSTPPTPLSALTTPVSINSPQVIPTKESIMADPTTIIQTQINTNVPIWSGKIEWINKTGTGAERIVNSVACEMCSNNALTTRDWPDTMNMQLLPQIMLQKLQKLFANSPPLIFNFSQQDLNAFGTITSKMILASQAGYISFPQNDKDTNLSKSFVLLCIYSKHRKAFIGLIPNDSNEFVNGFRIIVQSYKDRQIKHNQGLPAGPMPNILPGQPIIGQSITGQNIPGPSITGPSIPGQPITGQNIPGQPITGQNIPGQPITGQNIPGQPITGQNIPGQPITGPRIQGQQISGQNIPRQSITAQQNLGKNITNIIHSQSENTPKIEDTSTLTKSSTHAQDILSSQQEEDERRNNLEQIKLLQKNLAAAQQKERHFIQQHQIPGMQDQPIIQGQPGIPGQPIIQGQPGMPGQPIIQGQPGQPGLQSVTASPALQGQPVLQGQPGMQGQPVLQGQSMMGQPGISSIALQGQAMMTPGQMAPGQMANPRKQSIQHRGDQDLRNLLLNQQIHQRHTLTGMQQMAGKTPQNQMQQQQQQQQQQHQYNEFQY